MTIKDLSAQTGYSVGTVSRVLNNQPNVSEKARRIILQAASATGFQLNANAKQLKQQHSNTILILVKGTSNQLFSALVEALQSRIAETGHPVSVDYMDEDANEVRRALQLSVEKKPLGILFLGGNRQNFIDDFHHIRVPCVLITNDAADLPFSNLSSVSSDDRAAARQAIEALASHGHRSFAVIGGDCEKSDTTKLRFLGCADAFAAHGIAFDSALDYETVRFSYEDGYQGACRLLERGRPFTALFAMSDVMAIGAIRALTDYGRRVPEDVSVMGFDGLPISSYSLPRLSTVSQNVQQLANRSIDILLAALDGSRTPQHETVGVAVMIRESIRTHA